MTEHGIVTEATAATEFANESAAIEAPRRLDEVVVLDYGGQYSQLIARRVRECGVFSELLPHHVGADEVARRAPKGLILSGGAAAGDAGGAPRPRPRPPGPGLPPLGLCFRMPPLGPAPRGGGGGGGGGGGWAP